MKPLVISFVTLFLFSCTPENSDLRFAQDTFVPIYALPGNVAQISVEPAQQVINAGKIYAYGNYIFQNDLNSGIHIIDASDKKLPKKVSFLKIPLCTELAVKGNFLYTNNHSDIVVFDISNPAQPQLVKRVKDVFPPANQKYPPLTNVYFECPDETKGVVVRWELKKVDAPKCRR